MGETNRHLQLIRSTDSGILPVGFFGGADTAPALRVSAA